MPCSCESDSGDTDAEGDLTYLSPFRCCWSLIANNGSCGGSDGEPCLFLLFCCYCSAAAAESDNDDNEDDSSQC